jgi:hypothetical protein
MQRAGIFADVFYNINILNRLVSFKDSKLSFHFWLREKLWNLFRDRAIIKKLKNFDAIIISETIPNIYYRQQFNIESFKNVIQKPIGIFAVYYLGNAPTQIKSLRDNNQPELERFNFHLSVSSTTEIREPVSGNYFPVGLRGESFELKPVPKAELLAIIDFAHPGNEAYRKVQINALEHAGIKYILLEGSYSVEEIRAIYQQGAIYFMQSSEAFGLPLLECLSCGCQIFTPHSWWPMSWRLNESPEIHGEGILPDCFTVYNSADQLSEELIRFKENYDLGKTPKKVFDNFISHYPDFYNGNQMETSRLLVFLQNEING